MPFTVLRGPRFLDRHCKSVRKPQTAFRDRKRTATVPQVKKISRTALSRTARSFFAGFSFHYSESRPQPANPNVKLCSKWLPSTRGISLTVGFSSNTFTFLRWYSPVAMCLSCNFLRAVLHEKPYPQQIRGTWTANHPTILKPGYFWIFPFLWRKEPQKNRGYAE